MKIKSLTIQNIGLIRSEIITIDKPLILFYGEIKQGKTTILNCIRWAFGGSFPKDILTHGEDEGFIEIELEDGLINRSFYINKDGETTARDLKIILNKRPAKVNDLKKLLNPFLLNQDYLVEMKESERNKFIVELFQIETGDLDSDLIREETKAQNLRTKIKIYGEVRPVFMEKPDVDALITKKSEIEQSIAEQKEAVKAENEAIKAEYEAKRQKAFEEILDFNLAQKNAKSKIETSKEMLNNIYASVKDTIFESCFDIESAKALLETLPKPLELKQVLISSDEPSYLQVDDSELIDITSKIRDCEIQQIKYENYLKEVEKEEQKMALATELKKTEDLVKIIRREKAAKQESINGLIDGLEYKDFALWYENTSFEMLSTSQLMNLSSKLSDLYPESLGLELIDRGESMGKSVLRLVEKAQNEEKNILVTIVGEKPAEIPENIGVFVVENGAIQ